jgi:hypothetical protein
MFHGTTLTFVWRDSTELHKPLNPAEIRSECLPAERYGSTKLLSGLS